MGGVVQVQLPIRVKSLKQLEATAERKKSVFNYGGKDALFRGESNLLLLC